MDLYTRFVVRRRQELNCFDFLPVACRGLAMPWATASRDAPFPNSCIRPRRVVVFVIEYTVSVTAQSDGIFTFANQRFGEFC